MAVPVMVSSNVPSLTAMVVIALSAGRMRFGDLRATVDGISGKVLTDTLRDLERDGLVARHVYAEVPPGASAS